MKEENAKLREKIQELSKQIRARGSINKSEGKVFQDLAKFQEENEELKRGILEYRSGTLNSNTVNSKFHLIRSFFEIFARFLSFHV